NRRVVACIHRSPGAGLSRGECEILRLAEDRLLLPRLLSTEDGAGEADLAVHRYLDFPGASLFLQRLRHLGQQELADHTRKLFGKRKLDLLVAGSFNRAGVRIVGVNAESSARLGFDMEVELDWLISRSPHRKIQSGKFPRQAGADIGLNFLLQLFP